MRLDLPESLERVLSSTNLIENLFSRVRDTARRGKRWHGGMMILRWTGAGCLKPNATSARSRAIARYRSWLQHSGLTMLSAIAQASLKTEEEPPK
jgi:hypothetical protein